MITEEEEGEGEEDKRLTETFEELVKKHVPANTTALAP